MNKKILKIITITIAVLLCMQPRAQKCEDIDKSEIYRLHIIANSNSPEDQSVKLAVRDEILRFEKELFDDSINSAHDAKQLLMENADRIYEIAESTLRENGFSYGLRISTGIYDFPDRTYKGTLYPAGKYDALRLVLGDGKGENWWCVMFPPLCIIDDDAGKIEGEESKAESKMPTEFESVFAKLCEWFIGLFD